MLDKNSKLILHGAGSAGRYCLRFLREKGIEPLCFADNDRSKIGTVVDGLMVTSPAQAADEWASHNPKWIACAISRPAAPEIRSEIKARGAESISLYECLPVCHGLPSDEAWRSTYALCADAESDCEWRDQMKFRANPDYDAQSNPTPCDELYFPDFIKKLDHEHFVDAGACQGDTVEAFTSRWDKWEHITAFEPDRRNFATLRKNVAASDKIDVLCRAVGDENAEMEFVETADYAAHLGRDGATYLATCIKLDDFLVGPPPTYIKADVEGAELQLLWGARRILKEHMPVLAICAYHTSDHIWQIPMLVKAIQPNYSTHLRRYAEGAFELVWYCVPPDRVI